MKQIYIIDPSKQKDFYHNLGKHRAIIGGLSFVFSFLMVFSVFRSRGFDQSFMLFVPHIFLWMLIAYLMYLSPRIEFKNFSIELDQDKIHSIKFSKKDRDVQIRHVKHIKVTMHGLILVEWWRRAWIPSALVQFDEIKQWVEENVDSDVFRWERNPALYYGVFEYFLMFYIIGFYMPYKFGGLDTAQSLVFKYIAIAIVLIYLINYIFYELV